jgi:hypothetical protein
MDDADWFGIVVGFALLGAAARAACEDIARRMPADAALCDRVRARHSQMAAAYAEGHPGASLSAAREAGRRAYLIVLLIEAGRGAPTTSS